ncbi:Hsp70 family protein [Patescibacteria group bacterium]|nr:Hsp70 family protein [Patescibacteria group bacterium]
MVPEIIEVEINLGGRLFQSLKTALASSVVNSFNLFGKEYLLEELIGKFLGELKTKADKVVGQNVKQLVLGRPVHFIGENDELAEKRLHKAATLAGFEKIVFELEPVGAAWDWFSKNSLKRQKILVFDFGGGTLDFTIVSFPEKIVLANGGLPIGGDLFNSEIFDTRLSAYFGRGATFSDKNLNFPPSIFQQLKNWHAISMLKTRKFMNTIDSLSYKCSDETALKALKSLLFDSLGFMLYQDIDWLKKQLSYKDMERLEFRVKDIDINEIISRADFEKMINMYLEQIEKGIDLVLLEAGIGKEKIGLVVTTGGSSLIPIVRILLEQKFGEEKIKSMQAFTSVAYGLALRAGELF